MSNRRLPVYILIDTSGSMNGEPIHSVNSGLQNMLSTLKQDPFALESVWLSLITFDNEVKEVIPLMQLEDVLIPEIVVPKSGATFMGAALELLLKKIASDTKKTTQDEKGDWRPLLFIMTDGSPSDIEAFENVIPQIKALNFAAIIACAAGPKAKKEYLLALTENIAVLDVMDSAAFSSFFKWLSSSVSSGSSSVGLTGPNTLPPPPPEIQLVI
jgi:uncharacterized protein YegL